jgi:hypothetical protein
MKEEALKEYNAVILRAKDQGLAVLLSRASVSLPRPLCKSMLVFWNLGLHIELSGVGVNGSGAIWYGPAVPGYSSLNGDEHT